MTEKEKLDEQQRAVTDRLRRLWAEKEREERAQGRRFTQQMAADALGVSQGMVGHWLNHREPIGTITALRFAHYLGVSPLDIDPNWAFADTALTRLSEEDLKVVAHFASLPAEARKQVGALVEMLAQSNTSRREVNNE